MPGKKWLILGLSLLIAWGITSSGIAFSEANPAFLWQGHELRLERMTTDWDEVTSLSSNPYPAEGVLVLALLTCADGVAVTEAEIAAGEDDFLLTDGEGNQARPIEWIQKPAGFDIGLVFYVAANNPDLSAITLQIEPPEKEADSILGAELLFQGYALTVTAATTDRASLGYYAEVWPDDGCLVAVEFSANGDGAMSQKAIRDNAYQIVLTDGDGQAYPYAKSLIGTDPKGIQKFWLAFAVTGDPPPAAGALQPAIRLPAALWVSAWERDTRTVPFDAFIPSEPVPFTVAFALENHSMYKHESVCAAEKPGEAFETRKGDIDAILSDCKALLGSEVVTVENPDKASVFIGIDIQYPSAGRYGTVGNIFAYNCTLTLTAYDALTHSPLATLRAGYYYGNSISVAPGVSTVWKEVPPMEEADAKEARAFVKALMEFWGE